MGCQTCTCCHSCETDFSLLPQKFEPQPFFDGQILQERMKHIRSRFIQTVRQKYSKEYYDINMKRFVDFVQNQSSKQIISNISYHYWTDDVSQENMKFGMILAYTNQKINQSIISLVNSILRQKNMEDDQKFQLAVFLIEAINIDLYLITIKNPKLSNFQGLVYRGFTCKVTDYQLFEKINQKPLENRVISVPLSLWSTSKSLNVAKNFLQIRSKKENEINIILFIHVISLDPEDLALYQKSFSSSVVSTICAVDISAKQLTKFPQEMQVLLRGAFCLILDIVEVTEEQQYSDKLLCYKKINCVMVNANRDHISTNHLGDQADAARNLFGSLAKKARMKFAEDYFKNKAKAQEATYFEKKKQIQVQKIQQFRTERQRQL